MTYRQIWGFCAQALDGTSAGSTAPHPASPDRPDLGLFQTVFSCFVPLFGLYLEDLTLTIRLMVRLSAGLLRAFLRSGFWAGHS